MPHTSILNAGAYIRKRLWVCRQAPTGILGAVRACKHVLRVREGSRNGCGICQACLRQKSCWGVENFSIFTGIGRIGVGKRRLGGGKT